MSRRTISYLFALALILATLVACSPTSASTTNSESQVVNTSSTTTGSNVAVSSTVSAGAGAVSVAEAVAENSASHDDAADYVWDNSTSTQIILNGSTITTNGTGVTVTGNIATITSAGTYTISGSLTDGQIIVNTEDEATVKLILNGVDIRSATSAPLVITHAQETVIVLADNSENYLADGATYVFADPEVDEPNAALFSTGDLTIYGSGSLNVTGNYNDGIVSKDGLIIASGNITVNAVDDGIRGKDYLVIKDGTITVNAQGDGLKSDNEEDATLGYIAVETGVVNVTAGGDALQATTDVLISDGTFVLTTGGGSNRSIAADASAKGIKGVVNVNIDGGTFTIDSADDALHSNGNLVVNAGTFNLTTGDDGLHADATIIINGGDIAVMESYEGIESAVITINDGIIHIVASDDGLNVAGGNDGSGMNRGPGGRQGGDAVTYTGSYYLYINGGYVVVDAAGDGVDVNGAVEMTDGVVIVNGPTAQMNAALDYDASFKITGGFFLAVGSSGMAQAPDTSSTQYSLLLNLNNTQAAGTLVHIQNSAGEDILTFAPSKNYESISLSSPELAQGEVYTVYLGGETTGTGNDGLYSGGAYTGGTEYTDFTVSTVVTGIGNSGRR